MPIKPGSQKKKRIFLTRAIKAKRWRAAHRLTIELHPGLSSQRAYLIKECEKENKKRFRIRRCYRR